MPETSTAPPVANRGAHQVWDQICPGLAERITDLRENLRGYLADCPVADDVIQLVSELAANAVRHSRSGQPGGTFTARVEQFAACTWGEVRDQGSDWTRCIEDSARSPHGLHLLRTLASAYGRERTSDNSVLVWFRIDHPKG